MKRNQLRVSRLTLSPLDFDLVALSRALVLQREPARRLVLLLPTNITTLTSLKNQSIVFNAD